ncbi:MAG TPA: hypothetical protein VLQ48_09420 [Chloroflexia bacterium]|nr:hypothetical protein [Chloroflexia bacterium]
MFDFNEWEAHERQNERMQEAENARMVRLAKGCNKKNPGLSGRALTWIGNRLVETGRRM